MSRRGAGIAKYPEGVVYQGKNSLNRFRVEGFDIGYTAVALAFLSSTNVATAGGAACPFTLDGIAAPIRRAGLPGHTVLPSRRLRDTPKPTRA